MKKVILVTEYINPPYDEGIKKTVYSLFLKLNKKGSKSNNRMEPKSIGS